jgi:ferric iron reductase protein FhuF
MTPVAEIYHALRPIAGSWRVEIGRPHGPGWIAGVDLAHASDGPFHDLLRRIGERSGAPSDRRTIAALFSLRLGWASAMAIAPWLRFRCVPDVSLGNVSFRFRESTFLEQTAVHEPRGVVVTGDPRTAHPSMSGVADESALLAALRAALVAQSAPVVETLHAWSGFSYRGIWGQLTSSWASHVTGLSDRPHDQRGLLPLLDALFAGDDLVAAMRPRMHVVEEGGAFHLFQRRASCCRYYLVPEGTLCASCPLVSDEERLMRNRAFMAQRRRGAEAQK